MRPVFFGDRYRAAGTHFAFGALIALALFWLVRFAWYPDALFDALNARSLTLAVIAVLVLGGPLALLVVFLPGKRGLAFDLVAIAVLETAAVAAGMWLLFDGRPVYLVFVKDRFELVRPHDFPESELARAHASPYLDMPRAGPDVVGSRFPKDNAERQRIMFLGSSGVDLQHMPQHYVPFEEVRAEVLARAEPLSRLAALNPGREPEIDAIAEASGVPREAIVFLPMRVGPRDLTVLLDRRGGRRFNIGALRPWEY